MATSIQYYSGFVALISILVVQYSHVVTAAAPPSYRGDVPIFDVCQEVASVCGRGECVHVSNNTVGFECECEYGWRQDRLQEDEFLKFLPCVIPNCTIDITCTDADRPRNPDDEYNRRRPDTSYLDPCSNGDCGGGRCKINETNPYTRTCECEKGYYNLLNSTIYPCYRKCAFGNECPGVGYNTTTSIIDPNPFAYNQATSLIARAEFACLFTMAITLVRAVMWNNI